MQLMSFEHARGQRSFRRLVALAGVFRKQPRGVTQGLQSLSLLARVSRALPQLKHKTPACTYLTQLRRQRNFNYDNAQNINPHLSKHASPPPLFLFSLYIFYFRRGAKSFGSRDAAPLDNYILVALCIYATYAPARNN